MTPNTFFYPRNNTFPWSIELGDSKKLVNTHSHLFKANKGEFRISAYSKLVFIILSNYNQLSINK
ncbi:hypothetical protein BTU51_0147 [Rickettsia rickettsii]|uniref:Uncharacterized protein n=1 Tax=Rickettsia rickettsii (strain Iowa) TaxID=452659 RepID=B0BW40_RICRO|nr:hypothetical protein RrIowa_0147 [Rickettsia rickettsii str. Iowa]APU55018.1 hypothetical protein BTU50_0147 [Rickettsia rickettsii]APU56395.1 hypothetical protein BTU51_0147 [Rickettsia rickettsii]